MSVAVPLDQHVGGWQDNEREKSGAEEAPNHRGGEALHDLRPGAGGVWLLAERRLETEKKRTEKGGRDRARPPESNRHTGCWLERGGDTSRNRTVFCTIHWLAGSKIHRAAARYAQRTSPPRARQKTETGRQVLTTSLHRAATSSHYSRNDNVRNRTDIRWASQAHKPAPGIERRGAAKREVILPSEGSAPAVKTEAIRSEEVSDCTTDCGSMVSVVQASPSQLGTDEAPHRRSWTPSETVPHGAVFGPEASTASVLVWSVSPVTPHAYCTSGAPALTSSARATRTRVFSNVWESSLIVGNIFV